MAQEKWLVDGPKTIDIGGAAKLKVGLVGGQIDIIAHDEPGVRVEVHGVSGKDLKVSVDGDTVEIDHPQLGWDNWFEVFTNFPGRATADISVMVPREIRVKLGVVRAAVLVTGVTGPVDLSTVSGELVADAIAGDLQINTVSGEVTVRDHAGKVLVNSVSGDLTASGSITTLKGDSVSGSVYLDLRGVADEVRVNTVSGAVTTRLDSGVPAAYSFATVGGRLHVDGGDIRGVRGQYTGRFGELEGRWSDLRINTVGGDITVLHTSRATADADARDADAAS